MNHLNEYLLVLPDGRRVSNYSREYLQACEHWWIHTLAAGVAQAYVDKAATERSRTQPARRAEIAQSLTLGALAIGQARTGFYALWPRQTPMPGHPAPHGTAQSAL